jgi:hypothetical protein
MGATSALTLRLVNDLTDAASAAPSLFQVRVRKPTTSSISAWVGATLSWIHRTTEPGSTVAL